MTEIEAKKNLETLERFYRIAKSGSALHEVLINFVTLEDLVVAIHALEEIQQYRAIGTVEEVQKAKKQYDDIHSVAEKTALIGLSDYGTAKEALITEMKRSLDCSLKEYQSIGTIEELKALKKEVELYRNLDKTNFSDGYNKAIDETCLKIFNHLLSEIEWNRVLVDDWNALAEEFKEIAEQMRGGGK